MEKEYLDVDDNIEFEKLFNRVNLTHSRLKALSTDYGNYYTKNCLSSPKATSFHEITSNFQFRLNSAVFHIELLCSYIKNIENELNILNKHHYRFLSSESSNFSYIFDSIIYHITSLFDYIATIANCIIVENQNYLKWNGLALSNKDKDNIVYKYANRIHSEFVDKLFTIRSTLIHNKVVVSGVSYSKKYSMDGTNHSFTIPTNKGILKNFKALEDLSESKDISIKYSAFFIINKTIFYVTDILFLLKAHIEQNKRFDKLDIFIVEDGIKKPASKLDWYEQEYLNSKKSESN